MLQYNLFSLYLATHYMKEAGAGPFILPDYLATHYMKETGAGPFTFLAFLRIT